MFKDTFVLVVETPFPEYKNSVCIKIVSDSFLLTSLRDET